MPNNLKAMQSGRLSYKKGRKLHKSGELKKAYEYASKLNPDMEKYLRVEAEGEYYCKDHELINAGKHLETMESIAKALAINSIFNNARNDTKAALKSAGFDADKIQKHHDGLSNLEIKGMKNDNGVQSAIEFAFALYGGHYLNVTFVEKLFVVVRAIAQGHVFLDGNKRTAVYALRQILQCNGYNLETDANLKEIIGKFADKKSKMNVKKFYNELSGMVSPNLLQPSISHNVSDDDSDSQIEEKDDYYQKTLRESLAQDQDKNAKAQELILALKNKIANETGSESDSPLFTPPESPKSHPNNASEDTDLGANNLQSFGSIERPADSCGVLGDQLASENEMQILVWLT